MTQSERPWHQPGKWLVNPAYWDDEAKAARPRMRGRIRFIDCTVSEGDDCVGHQLNWNTRLGVIERLDAIGVGEITLPSHVTFSEERDLIKACRRMGVRTPLVAKGPGGRPPLQGDWKSLIDRHIDLGTGVLSPIFKWRYEDTLGDFSAGLSREAIVDAIHESVAYMKQHRVRVVPWMEDSMRSTLDTACLFFKAMPTRARTASTPSTAGGTRQQGGRRGPSRGKPRRGSDDRHRATRGRSTSFARSARA